METKVGKPFLTYSVPEGCGITVDYNCIRINASIVAMHAIAESLGSIDYNKELIAKHAVDYADALVEELKKGGQDEND